MSLRSAQRTTLAIGIPIILVVIGWTGLNLVNLLGMKTVTESLSFALSGARHVSVDTGSGSVTVTSGSVEEVEVMRTSRYGLARPQYIDGATDEGVALGGHCSPTIGFNCTVSYEITVPADVSVDLASGSGTIRVSGIHGDVVARAGSGSVLADGLPGALTLRSSSGTVRATGIDATTVTASTGSGSVLLDFTTAPRDVTARSGSGGVRIGVPPGSGPYRVDATTGSGTRTVDVRTDPSSAKTITAHIGSGDVAVGQS